MERLKLLKSTVTVRQTQTATPNASVSMKNYVRHCFALIIVSLKKAAINQLSMKVYF